jgi:hypothetical protein|tara:strand:+ start:150 stop:365 length:216 start_codon:yes stop_codon:yes gene_type:complete
MISNGVFRGRASPVMRTPTPFKRSVMNKHEVHQHAKTNDVTRAYAPCDTGRTRQTAGISSISVAVVAVNST